MYIKLIKEKAKSFIKNNLAFSLGKMGNVYLKHYVNI